MDSSFLRENLIDLIRITSIEIPPDIEAALKKGYRKEKKGSPAKNVLKMMLDSIALSKERFVPLCQDTGSMNFHVYYPDGSSLLPVEKEILKAVKKSTVLNYLRPNSVDPVTGENTGNNSGDGVPGIHWHPTKAGSWKIKLLLKGGGSENVGSQYTLPNGSLNAGRDLDGVYKIVLDAVWQAQGRGCSPGVICVAIGGTRDSGLAEAKEQCFRKLDDVNPNPKLARLERKLYRDLNTMKIGPMGFGGYTTALGVKISALHRVPASYFVSICYLCWSARRAVLTIRGDKASISI